MTTVLHDKRGCLFDAEYAKVIVRIMIVVESRGGISDVRASVRSAICIAEVPWAFIGGFVY